MSNVPDDWGMYYSKCLRCGGINHASGCEECYCRDCQWCSLRKPPDEMESEDTCCDCAESGVWAWHEADWEERLDDVYEMLDSMESNCEGVDGAICKIKRLQDTLKVIQDRLAEGFKP